MAAFNSIEARASKWTLADDHQLGNALEELVNGLLDKSANLAGEVRTLERSVTKIDFTLEMASSAIGLYSSRQFIEQRVREDDSRPVLKSGASTHKILNEQERQGVVLREVTRCVQSGLGVISQRFRPAQETVDEDEFVQYQPVNPYDHPLPVMIGSESFLLSKRPQTLPAAQPSTSADSRETDALPRSEVPKAPPPPVPPPMPSQSILPLPSSSKTFEDSKEAQQKQRSEPALVRSPLTEKAAPASNPIVQSETKSRESSANHSIGTSSSSTSYAKADSALRNQEKPSIFDYDSEEDNALFIESFQNTKTPTGSSTRAKSDAPSSSQAELKAQNQFPVAKSAKEVPNDTPKPLTTAAVEAKRVDQNGSASLSSVIATAAAARVLQKQEESKLPTAEQERPARRMNDNQPPKMPEELKNKRKAVESKVVPSPDASQVSTNNETSKGSGKKRETTKKSFFDDSDDSDMDLFKPIAERKKPTASSIAVKSMSSTAKVPQPETEKVMSTKKAAEGIAREKRSEEEGAKKNPAMRSAVKKNIFDSDSDTDELFKPFKPITKLPKKEPSKASDSVTEFKTVAESEQKPSAVEADTKTSKCNVIETSESGFSATEVREVEADKNSTEDRAESIEPEMKNASFLNELNSRLAAGRPNKPTSATTRPRSESILTSDEDLEKSAAARESSTQPITTSSSSSNESSDRFSAINKGRARPPPRRPPTNTKSLIVESLESELRKTGLDSGHSQTSENTCTSEKLLVNGTHSNERLPSEANIEKEEPEALQKSDSKVEQSSVVGTTIPQPISTKSGNSRSLRTETKEVFPDPLNAFGVRNSPVKAVAGGSGAAVLSAAKSSKAPSKMAGVGKKSLFDSDSDNDLLEKTPVTTRTATLRPATIKTFTSNEKKAGEPKVTTEADRKSSIGVTIKASATFAAPSAPSKKKGIFDDSDEDYSIFDSKKK